MLSGINFRADYIFPKIFLKIELCSQRKPILTKQFCRWIHEPSGRIYSYSYKPPKVEGFDDETGEPLVQRHDDKPETVRARLQLYDESTSPLVEYFENNGVLKSFKGTQSDVIYPEVKKWLESCFDE